MTNKRLYAPLVSTVLSLLLYSCSNLDISDPDSLQGINWQENQGSSSSANAANLSSGMQTSSSMQGYSAPASSSSSRAASVSSSSAAPSSSSSSSIISSSSYSSSSAGLSDGNVSTANHSYKTITIGTQTWMAENLNEGTFVRASVPVQSFDGQIADDSLEKYCFDNIEGNCSSRGGLYTWAEAMNFPAVCNEKAGCTYSSTSNGICPVGWHLPSRADFEQLIKYAGGANIAGAMLKASRGTKIWDNPVNNYDDSLGFGAKGAGFYYYENEISYSFAMNEGAELYWISEELNDTKAYQYTLDASDTEFKVEERTKLSAVSVRCIKNN